MDLALPPRHGSDLRVAYQVGDGNSHWSLDVFYTMHLQLHWNMGKYKHNLVRSYVRENLQLPNSFLHTQEYSYAHV
jgi:hypothetical protein